MLASAGAHASSVFFLVVDGLTASPTSATIDWGTDIALPTNLHAAKTCCALATDEVCFSSASRRLCSDVKDSCRRGGSALVTKFVPLAPRNEGLGEGREGTDRTQLCARTGRSALSTRVAYPLGYFRILVPQFFESANLSQVVWRRPAATEAGADCCGDPLRRSLPHVSRGEDTRDAGLERHWRSIERPAARRDVPAGEDVAGAVALEHVPQPTGVGLRPDWGFDGYFPVAGAVPPTGFMSNLPLPSVKKMQSAPTRQPVTCFQPAGCNA
jgi:hypothetical protein